MGPLTDRSGSRKKQLRMSGAMSLPFHIPSWRKRGHLYIFLPLKMSAFPLSSPMVNASILDTHEDDWTKDYTRLMLFPELMDNYS
jgi:hypothetical protein